VPSVTPRADAQPEHAERRAKRRSEAVGALRAARPTEGTRARQIASLAASEAAWRSEVTRPVTGAPAPGAPGLVSEGRMGTGAGEVAEDPDGVGWSLRDDECPLTDVLAVDITTGEVAWRPTCKNARCRRCSRQVSAQTFALARRALADGGEVVPGLPIKRRQAVDRVRFITLTRAPEGWQETREAMHTWLQRLRREGYSMHVLWVVEKGSTTGMKHVHAIQWGSYIPKEVLSASWPHGSTQIEAAQAAIDYLAKGVLRYVAKGIDGDPDSLEDHMNLNGGRAAHWSRDFFAGQGRNAFREANPLPGVYFVGQVR
jgi:hypothetical protein